MGFDLDQWLAIVSLALSLGGLVASLLGGPNRKLIVFSTMFTLLLGLTSIMVFIHLDHAQKIGRIQAEITAFLAKHEEAPFEEIFKNLHTMEEGEAREALLKSTESGSIQHEQKAFSIGDGKDVEVRYYKLTGPLQTREQVHGCPATTAMIPKAMRTAHTARMGQ